MAREVYRYQFSEDVPFEEVESSLLLAIWATESLHGEAQVRLDAGHAIDAALHVCVIDAQTEVGSDLNRLFVGFLRREFHDAAFTVERCAADLIPEHAQAA